MRSLNTKDVVLPPNPSWITFEDTDGDSRRWPTNTSPVLDAEGHVNYMLPLDEDHPAAIKWRMICGASIAEMLKYPDYQTKKYVLKSWPAGYCLYDHNKGPAANPRHDLYLVGSELVARFRSPHELTPHAVWLLTDKTRDRVNCVCKYCARRPQREVTQGLPVAPRTGSSTPSFQGGRSTREKRKQRPARAQNPIRVQAVIRRAPRPVKLPKGPSQYSSPERERDLLAIVHSTNSDRRSPKQTRWARNGELVWVRLKAPVALDEHSDPGQGIVFWPGLIQQYELRIKTTRREDANTDDNKSYPDTNDEDCPWDIKHTNVFQVRLLIANQDVRVEESELLPYQAYAPTTDLIEVIQKVSVQIETYPGLDDSRDVDVQALDRFAKFEPHPPGGVLQDQAPEMIRERMLAAAPAFALAIQIASILTSFWTPVESWECRLIPQIPTGIQQESQSISPLGAGSSSISPSSMAAGSSSSLAGPVQIRFQGLWWGPERIWVGDLVRLKLARYQFAPHGSDLIAKPASATHPPIMDGEDVEMADAGSSSSGSGNGIGASSRGLFLRIDSIYSEQRDTSPGGKPTAMLSGMLYELIDEDWEEGKDSDEAHSNLQSTFTSPNGPSQPPASLSQAPLFIPNPSLLTAGPLTGSSESSDDILNLKEDTDVVPQDKGKGKAPADPPIDPPITRPRRHTFKPSPDSISDPSGTTGPLSAPSPAYAYRLPAPPTNHKFRPILPKTHEATMSVVLLSGRYYPGLLKSRLMQPYVEAATISSGSEPEISTDQAHAPLWALEGYVAGVHNAVDPSVWKSSRVGMIRAASDTAKSQLLGYWKSREEPDPDVIITE